MQAMPKKQRFLKRLRADLRVGLFLAKRDITRSNKWTTVLIVFIMMLTFLNLVAVSGILEGLIQGAIDGRQRYGSGDLAISPFLNKTDIPHTAQVIDLVKNLPDYQDSVVRYYGDATVETDYRKTVKAGEMRDTVGASLFGIDPSAEIRFSGLDQKMVEGTFLNDDDVDSVIVGKNLDYKYTPIQQAGFKALKNVEVGNKIMLTVGNVRKEYLVKGVIKSKMEFDMAIIMLNSEVRKLTGNNSFFASNISVRLLKGADPVVAKNQLLAAGVGDWALVQTFEEAIPKTVLDMRDTFAVLGTILSAIGLAVSAVTVFIVIFVNAVTRRRFIGILKGIGITERAIEISYVLQAMFYAVFGSVLGLIVTFFILKPGIAAHPIDFPFSDGVMVATYSATFMRGLVLLITTLISGYVPARLIIKQNTLSAILGR